MPQLLVRDLDAGMVERLKLRVRPHPQPLGFKMRLGLQAQDQLLQQASGVCSTMHPRSAG